MVDKYTWVDIGSSYLPGELIAAFLLAQLEEAQAITARRLQIWEKYHVAFAGLEEQGLLRRPIIPADCQHNAHMYYLLVKDLDQRTRLLAHLKARGILAVFHYVPLHSSPAGLKWARSSGEMPVTTALSNQLLRLPLWLGLEEDGQQEQVVAAVQEFFKTVPD
jgi:dTDP-4-amino-4,6-dideoxygalactose transaminase